VGYGALYQGRFKSFIVQDDRHFLVLCRYVEANARRGKLVKRAEAWPWGSAAIRSRGGAELQSLLSDWPIDRPRQWTTLLNTVQGETEIEAIHTSIKRNRPLGEGKWVDREGRNQLTKQRKNDKGLRPRLFGGPVSLPGYGLGLRG
jgi:putative transposase